MPKGIDISAQSQHQLNAIARQLNERPRETLGFQTPAEMFSELCIDQLNPRFSFGQKALKAVREEFPRMRMVGVAVMHATRPAYLLQTTVDGAHWLETFPDDH